MTRPASALRPVLAAALMTLAAAGPAAAQQAADEAKAPVRFGSLAGATGPVAIMMAHVLEARLLAIQGIDEAGGLSAGRASAVLADTGCSPDGARAAVGRLAGEGVRAFIGPSCSDEVPPALAAAPGAIFITDTATAAVLSELDDADRLFRTVPDDDAQAAALARLIRSEGIERVVVSHARTLYGEGLSLSFADAFERAGGRILSTQSHGASETGYGAQAGALAAKAPDAQALVLFAARGNTGEAYLRDAHGLFPRVFGSDAMADEDMLATLGSDVLRHAVFVSPGPDAASPGFARFEALALAEGLNPRAPFAANAYDAAFVAALAVEYAEARGVELPQALRAVSSGGGAPILPGRWREAREAIAAGGEIDYLGASGSLDFDAAGDAPGTFEAHQLDSLGRWTVTPLP